MHWLSRHKRKQIQPIWQHKTDGVLWRLIPSDNGYFVGEDREVNDKRVSFFCLDQQTGSPLWKDVHFSEPWWIGIETIHRERVFLHEYAAPDMPDHKKIIALDLKSGKTLWSNDEMKFVLAHDDRVYGSKDIYDRRMFYEVDAQTGNIVHEVDANYLTVLEETIPSARHDVVEFPHIFDPMNEESSQVKREIMVAVAGTNNPVQTEYLDKDNSLVVGFYNNLSSEGGKPDHEQQIVVINKTNDEILYSDTVNLRAITPVPDTFFSISDFVYYIKNKQVLIALNLTGISNTNDKN